MLRLLSFNLMPPSFSLRSAFAHRTMKRRAITVAVPRLFLVSTSSKVNHDPGVGRSRLCRDECPLQAANSCETKSVLFGIGSANLLGQLDRYLATPKMTSARTFAPLHAAMASSSMRFLASMRSICLQRNRLVGRHSGSGSRAKSGSTIEAVSRSGASFAFTDRTRGTSISRLRRPAI